MKHAFSSMKRIGRYIKPYRVTFYLVILFTILTVAFNAALPYLTGLPTTEISRNIAAGESMFNLDFSCGNRLLCGTIFVRLFNDECRSTIHARFTSRY